MDFSLSSLDLSKQPSQILDSTLHQMRDQKVTQSSTKYPHVLWGLVTVLSIIKRDLINRIFKRAAHHPNGLQDVRFIIGYLVYVSLSWNKNLLFTPPLPSWGVGGGASPSSELGYLTYTQLGKNGKFGGDCTNGNHCVHLPMWRPLPQKIMQLDYYTSSSDAKSAFLPYC